MCLKLKALILLRNLAAVCNVKSKKKKNIRTHTHTMKAQCSYYSIYK